MTNPLYDIEVITIDGKQTTLAPMQGKTLLVVNTASKCGFTPQFKGLQKLHEKYHEKGLVILGFPCNQFLSQDPGSNDDIGQFCQLNYGVDFPMHAKVEVNGPGTHPLFQLLKKEAKGLLGSEKIKWNFTKFLISPEGEVVGRFPPTTTPAAMEKDIQANLPVS
ncbi:MAG: glutathione peroxidase [Halomonadaceae bacterium]|nr:MAG: glutathione peroxidase [Halomonadaceae bacterium]